MAAYHSMRNEYVKDSQGGNATVLHGVRWLRMLGALVVLVLLAAGFVMGDAWIWGSDVTEVAAAPMVQPAVPEPQPVPTMSPVENAESVTWFTRADGRQAAQIDGVWYCTPRAMGEMDLFWFSKAIREDAGHRALYSCEGVS